MKAFGKVLRPIAIITLLMGIVSVRPAGACSLSSDPDGSCCATKCAALQTSCAKKEDRCAGKTDPTKQAICFFKLDFHQEVKELKYCLKSFGGCVCGTDCATIPGC